jgi:hypothetical protein
MKMTVKSLLLTIVISTLSVSSFSQLRLPLANALASDIRKIIRDYPHQFGSLQGDIIEENPQTTSYDCTFKVTGAETCTITKFSSGKRKVYSWQALMLTTDDFEMAKKKFRALYSQFKQLGVKMDYGETFYLGGKYEAPVEEKKFNSVILMFENPDQNTYKMKLEISMQYELLEWKVRVLVYEHERDDDEQGDTVE